MTGPSLLENVVSRQQPFTRTLDDSDNMANFTPLGIHSLIWGHSSLILMLVFLASIIGTIMRGTEKKNGENMQW